MMTKNIERRDAKEFNLDWNYINVILAYRTDGQLVWRVNRSQRVKAGMVAGSYNAKGHITIGIDGKSFMAHRIVYFLLRKYWPPYELDHKDGDKGNNRIGNLRKANVGQNQWNV